MCSKYWFTIILFLFTRISANPLDTLKPLLVDLQGWNASPAYGMNSYQKDMKIITASRNYTQVDRQLKAVLVFTDQISKIPWLVLELYLTFSITKGTFTTAAKLTR